jgi:hypothetical protein
VIYAAVFPLSNSTFALGFANDTLRMLKFLHILDILILSCIVSVFLEHASFFEIIKFFLLVVLTFNRKASSIFPLSGMLAFKLR